MTRLEITTTGAAALSVSDRDLTFTPDGSRLVYIGNNQTQLLSRALDSLEPTVLATGTQLRDPFVSPDGQWVGFGEFTTLKKVAISGGPAITIAELSSQLFGATWTPDDRIVFATAVTGLQSVPAGGGRPIHVTEPDRTRGEANHFWPQILPAGRTLLFTIRNIAGASQIALRDLRTGAQTVLVRDASDGQYVSSGHLVYVAGGALQAARFDLQRLQVLGPPVALERQMGATFFASGVFAVAPDGTLAYASARRAAFAGPSD